MVAHTHVFSTTST